MTRLRITHALIALAASLGAAAVAAGSGQAQTPSPPQTAANPAAQQGLAYARQVCAECHAVEPGVTAMPGAEAPSFTAIAATPGMTAMALNVWFSTSHRNMPNLIIPPSRKEDLYAYFDALRTAEKAARAAH
jgi:mono/diheme cytochrome c family protein